LRERDVCKGLWPSGLVFLQRAETSLACPFRKAVCEEGMLDQLEKCERTSLCLLERMGEGAACARLEMKSKLPNKSTNENTDLVVVSWVVTFSGELLVPELGY
jgi:hypothetical protein